MTHFDKISSAYAVNNDKFNHEIYAKIANLINPKISGKKILDIGNGGYFPYNIEDAESVTAVDISSEMLAQIQHPRITKIVGDARSLQGINDNHYDVVMLCFCIHHVNGDEIQSAFHSLDQIIMAAHSKLKKGGRLIITECTLNKYLYLIQRISYPITKILLRILKKDMIFFHSNPSIIKALAKNFSVSEVKVNQENIKLEQPTDPLGATFPGLIKIPAWMNFTQHVCYDVTKA